MHVKPEEAHAGARSAPQSPALRALTGHPLLPIPGGPEARMSPLRHLVVDASGVPVLVGHPHGKGVGAAASVASAASASGGAAAATSPNGTRMRGASYAEEGREVVYACTALNTLVEDLRVKYGLHPHPPHHGRRGAGAGAGGLRRTSGFEDGPSFGLHN
jgi:hypothetical protein